MKTHRQAVSKIGLIFLASAIGAQLSGCAQIWISPKSSQRTVARVQAEPLTHTVTRGETLFKIAKKYTGEGSNWTDIAAYNPGLKPSLIKPGNVILIPPELVASRGATGSPVSGARFMLGEERGNDPLGRYQASEASKAELQRNAKAVSGISKGKGPSAKRGAAARSRAERPSQRDASQREVILMDLPELDANAASPDRPVFRKPNPPASVAAASASAPEPELKVVIPKPKVEQKIESAESGLASLAVQPKEQRAAELAAPKRTTGPAPVVAKKLDFSGESARAASTAAVSKAAARTAKKQELAAAELPRPKNLVPPQPNKPDDNNSRSSFYSCLAERCTRRTF